jgi:hypothetical protein
MSQLGQLLLVVRELMVELVSEPCGTSRLVSYNSYRGCEREVSGGECHSTHLMALALSTIPEGLMC